MKSNHLLLAGLLMLSCSAVSAQDSVFVTRQRKFNQTIQPTGLDNLLFYNRQSVYGVNGTERSRMRYNVTELKTNPTGSTYTVICDNGKKSLMSTYDFNSEYDLHTYKKIQNPQVFCYSGNSKFIYVVDQNRNLLYVDSRSYETRDTCKLDFMPTQMVASSNGYFIAATLDNKAYIVNIEKKNIRKEFSYDAQIKNLEFSQDASYMGVLAGGTLTIYNTSDFSVYKTIEGLSNAVTFTLHPENKYVCVVTDAKTFTFYNLYDLTTPSSFANDIEGLAFAKFYNNSNNQPYLANIAQNSIEYKYIGGLAGNYTRALREQLNAKMMEWCKKKEGESDQEYMERISEESQKKQRHIFANEISTSLAGDMLANSSISLGRYNNSRKALELNIDGPTGVSAIYLNVPESEVGDFSDVSQLKFSDVQYGLTKDDKFEVIYANVTNKKTGKTYTYDNLDQQPVDFVGGENSFVSLELMKKASNEDIILNRIKKEVVAESQKKKLISEHTNISVNTNVEGDVDAEGNHINNYKVEFNYNVEQEYSAKEDFAAGKYLIEESHAAISTLQIITKAFENEFAQYIKAGKKLIIDITGSADATPIIGSIKYAGQYGNFVREPYYLNNTLSSMSVTKETGITSNDQLAFLRAQGVDNYLTKHLSSISQMNVDRRFHIELSEGKGSQYRRINVKFTFVDAL